MYLYRLKTQRPGCADIEADEEHAILPLLSNDPDIAEKKERSIAEGSGINSRALVNPMEIREDGEKKRLLKKAVKGISFGIKKNEIYVLHVLGPNDKFYATRLDLISTKVMSQTFYVVGAAPL
jgi:hypothetical protein